MPQSKIDFTVRIVDDIPRPRSSRTSRYDEVVQDILEDQQTRALDCTDETAAQAVYAGIKRAIEREPVADRNLTVTTRTMEDGTASVFVDFTGTGSHRK